MEDAAREGLARLRSLFGPEPAVHRAAGSAIEVTQDRLGHVRATDAQSAVEAAAVDPTVFLAIDRGCHERQCQTDRRYDEENQNEGAA